MRNIARFFRMTALAALLPLCVSHSAHAQTAAPDVSIEQAQRLSSGLATFRDMLPTADLRTLLHSQQQLFVSTEDATELLRHDPSLASREVSDAAALIRAGIAGDAAPLDQAETRLAEVLAARPTEHSPLTGSAEDADPITVLDRSAHTMIAASALSDRDVVVGAQARLLNAMRAGEQAFAHSGSASGRAALAAMSDLRLAIQFQNLGQLCVATKALDTLADASDEPELSDFTFW